MTQQIKPGDLAKSNGEQGCHQGRAPEQVLGVLRPKDEERAQAVQDQGLCDRRQRQGSAASRSKLGMVEE